jgi:predicted permease
MRVEHWLYSLPLRIRSLFRRREVEQELDEELRYHLEQSIESYVGRGMSREDARYAALRDFGGLEQQKEQCRDTRGINLIEHTMYDVRYALRILAQRPGFTLAALSVLALGIGANTAIFSVVNAVLLEPLPHPHADRLVQLMLMSPSWALGQKSDAVSIPQFNAWRAEQGVFQTVAAYERRSTAVNLADGDRSEQVKALRVSSEYFGLFGAAARQGRTFSAEEDRPGGPRIVVISDGLWRRRFGADERIVGTTVLAGTEPWEVIGVLAPEFHAHVPVDLYFPLRADPHSTNPGHSYYVAALLHTGVTLASANAQLHLVYERFRRRFPNWFSTTEPTEESFLAEPLADVLVKDVRPALRVLFAAVSLVLLIACANVANLLLARASQRQRELAIRTALGAGRQRIISQLLTESLLLALAGGAIGLVLAHAGVRSLMLMNAGNIPRVGPQGSAITLDWTVVAFTLVISAGTGILFGVLPAFTASRTSPGAVFKHGNAQAGRTSGYKRVHSVLVVAEVALAFVLLAGAALLIRSFQTLIRVDPGFDARNVLTLEMSLVGTRFSNTATLADLIREAERRVESVPGVMAVAATFSLPLEHRFGGPLSIEGRPDDTFGADACFVSHRYFEVFGVPIVRGRGFTTDDNESAPAVVLVNQMLSDGSTGTFQWSAPLTWPGGDALGQRVTMAKTMGPIEDRTRQIVGVLANVRDASLASPPQPTIYVPIAQLTDSRTRIEASRSPLAFAVRTSTDPHSLRAAIEQELRLASGGLSVGNVRSMEQITAASTARTAFNMTLLSIFAASALVLAVTGVYSVVSFSVRQRTNEIGIRIAIGASPREVRWIVVGQGLRLISVGVVLGFAGSLMISDVVRSLLFGVEASDPAILTLVAVLLTAVAILAVYVPARGATRIDPVAALRWE